MIILSQRYAVNAYMKKFVRKIFDRKLENTFIDKPALATLKVYLKRSATADTGVPNPISTRRNRGCASDVAYPTYLHVRAVIVKQDSWNNASVGIKYGDHPNVFFHILLLFVRHTKANKC